MKADKIKDAVRLVKKLKKTQKVISAISKDELLLYCAYHKKIRCITSLLTEQQYTSVEALVYAMLQDNIDDIRDELRKQGIPDAWIEEEE